MKNNFLQWIALCNSDPAHDPDPKKKKNQDLRLSFIHKNKIYYIRVAMKNYRNNFLTFSDKILNLTLTKL